MSGYCAFRTMEKAELKAISRRGGIASGKARREQRRMIEERKVEKLAEIGFILEGISTLKQIYKAMPPDEREELHEFTGK